MAECNVGLAVLAELYQIPDCPVRVGDELGSIAHGPKKNSCHTPLFKVFLDEVWNCRFPSMLSTGIRGFQLENYPLELPQNECKKRSGSQLDLRFLNSGNVSICVHWQVELIVNNSESVMGLLLCGAPYDRIESGGRHGIP